MTSGFKVFLEKLRKRRIIETLAAFIGGGWLIIEFVHFILIGHYHWPEKMLDITLITLIGALVSTLLWRWFSGRLEPRKFKLELVVIPLAILVTILLDISLLRHLKGPELETALPSPWKNSVAVLPFKDMSPQKDQDWFCEGISGDIINRLSNISELKVPARTSAFAFKGKDQDIRDIGNKLGVATVLEGSIQKVGSRLRILVDLVNIADGTNIWSQAFDRDLKDVFAIQDEIALTVADKLKLTLLGEEKAKLQKRSEIDPKAYEAYLQGLSCWWQGSEEGTRSALRYFGRAIDIDPLYAPAHAGVALAYVFASTFLGLWPPQEGVPLGKAAAQKAIELDPLLADAYVARGFARMNFDWDWAGAEKDFRQALELSPHSSLARDGYANYLVLRGRLKEATDVLDKALEMDPLSPGIHHDLGWAYRTNGQCELAIPHFLKALELEAGMYNSRVLLGLCYLLTGKQSQGFAELNAVLQSSPDWPWARSWLGYAYGVTDRPEEAKRILEELEVLKSRRYVAPSAQALIYISLGQNDLALDWLEKACQEHDVEMAFLKVDAALAPLRNEPRFSALLKKVGLDK